MPTPVYQIPGRQQSVYQYPKKTIQNTPVWNPNSADTTIQNRIETPNQVETPAPVIKPVVKPTPTIAPVLPEKPVEKPVEKPQEATSYVQKGNQTFAVTAEELPKFINQGYQEITSDQYHGVIPETPTTEKPTTLETPAPEVKDYSKDIASLVGAGYSNPQDIANNLGIDVNEVNNTINGDYNLSYQAQTNALQDSLDKTYSDTQEALNRIVNGTFNLTPDEQAQIDATRGIYDTAKREQMEVNRATEGSTMMNYARMGVMTTANQQVMDHYTTVVRKGVDKINDLETKAVASIQELKDKIQEKKYNAVKDLYDQTKTYLKEKKDTIKEIHDAAVKFKEDQDKAKQQELDNMFKYMDFDLKQAQAELDSSKFTYQQKQDMIQNALANDKFTWQQKVDMINSQLASDKFKYDQSKDAQNYQLELQKLQLEIKKASAQDNPTSYKEWQLSGGNDSGVTYQEFLLNKGAEKPATADQASSAGYTLRMKDSGDTITKYTDYFKKMGLFKQGWQTIAPNFMQSKEMQLLEQAERDFINAALRKESGAAIAPSEFESAKKQYFPQPGDTDAVIEQKAKNRMMKLQGMVLSSGPALSSDFISNLGKISYTSPEDFVNTHQSLKKELKKISDANPDLSDDELLQLYQAQYPDYTTTSFNNVGSDTNLATNLPVDNTKAGQCGRFVNKLTGLGLGDSYQSKIAKMDKSIKTPAPGMVFVMPYKNTGHTGFILAVNNGIATVKDSNWNLDEKVKTHTIPVSKMTGFTYA